jgi:DNA polymerase IV
MLQQSIIAHLDLDTFFYSVTCLMEPELKGKPVIIGGGDRGVVTTCSYEARKYGVHSAMPMRRALQLCPQAIVHKGYPKEYGKFSKLVTDMVSSAAPLYEKASIDEFYIDLTGMDKYFKPIDWAIALRKKIVDETKLPISMGISSSKLVSKIATDMAKPNGYLFVPFGKEKEFLFPLPVNKIPGVGNSTFETFKKLNLLTIGDVATCNKQELINLLGKYGEDLHNKANALYRGTVKNHREAKSISSETTFYEDSTDVDFIHSQLVRLTERVCYELRGENKLTTNVGLKLRHNNFETFSKQTVIAATAYDHEILPVVKKLFDQLYNFKTPIRLVGVRLSNFSTEVQQTSLFENIEEKNKLYKTIDDVKNSFGKKIIKRAGGS